MKIAIIGASSRARDIYLPVLRAFPNVEVAGIYGRNLAHTKTLVDPLGIRIYTNLQQVINDVEVDCIIACVDWTENAAVYQQLAQSDKPCLLETPLGHNPEAITDTFEALHNRRAFTDIAEQYHLRPLEILKRQILNSGILGELVYAYADGIGHEYHGVSLLRSYVGFDKTLNKAVSMQRDAPYFAHQSHQGLYFPGERIFHSMLEFSSGVQASFHWSWLNYKSPIRSRRSSGFYTTKGAVWGAECVVVTNPEEIARPINFERRTLMVKGTEVFVEIVATLDAEPIARWSNPFYRSNLNEDQIVAAGFVQNLLKACVDKLTTPLYAPYQAYQDHLIVKAMYAGLVS